MNSEVQGCVLGRGENCPGPQVIGSWVSMSCDKAVGFGEGMEFCHKP